MEIDDAAPAPVTQVLCCMCGAVTDANAANMCAPCVKAHVDIADGLIKEYVIVHCPECERYLQPPKYWSRAELESRELLALFLKRIRGLNKYHVVDASFLWTEPHSKRLKIKLVLQREVMAGTTIQQAVTIEFVVQWRQCELCAKVATGQPQWDAVVQLRQKVEHRRTFLFIEQLILKARMHENVLRLDPQPDGIDFFFNHRSHALQFVDFIQGQAATKRKDAEQLVSHDTKSNTAVQHHTFSLEIAAPCREDLMCLPRKVSKSLGGFGPIVLVHRVFSNFIFLDPSTLRAAEYQGKVYWKEGGFLPLATTRQQVTFYVVDVEPTGLVNHKLKQADITVTLEDDPAGQEWTVRSHLGGVLHPGCYAKGYLVENLNAASGAAGEADYEAHTLPDVVLVRRHYPDQAKRRHRRNWKVKRLLAREALMGKEGNAKKASGAAGEAADFEEFLDDLERDPEYRREVHLYRDGETTGRVPTRKSAEDLAATAAAPGAKKGGAKRVAPEEENPEVDLAELLDDFALDGGPAAADDGDDDGADAGGGDAGADADGDDGAGADADAAAPGEKRPTPKKRGRRE